VDPAGTTFLVREMKSSGEVMISSVLPPEDMKTLPLVSKFVIPPARLMISKYGFPHRTSTGKSVPVATVKTFRPGG